MATITAQLSLVQATNDGSQTGLSGGGGKLS